MRACCFGVFSWTLGLVPFSTGVVLVGDSRVVPLIGDVIPVVPGPWLMKEGIGADGALTGLVGIMAGKPESRLIGA